jgi:hypothetical protein
VTRDDVERIFSASLITFALSHITAAPKSEHLFDLERGFAYNHHKRDVFLIPFSGKAAKDKLDGTREAKTALR